MDYTKIPPEDAVLLMDDFFNKQMNAQRAVVCDLDAARAAGHTVIGDFIIIKDEGRG